MQRSNVLELVRVVVGLGSENKEFMPKCVTDLPCDVQLMTWFWGALIIYKIKDLTSSVTKEWVWGRRNESESLGKVASRWAALDRIQWLRGPGIPLN